MSRRPDFGDVSLFTVGGAAMLGDISNVNYSLDFDTEDGAGPAHQAKSMQIVKGGAKITTTLASAIAGCRRVSHLNMTGFSIGEYTFSAAVSKLQFSAEFTKDMQAGNGEIWKKPQVVEKHFTASCDVNAITGDFPTFMDLLHADPDNAYVSLLFAIGSTSFEVPMTVKNATHDTAKGKIQNASFSLEGRHPCDGEAYPIEPSGSPTTLLQTGIINPFAEMNYAFTSKAVGGVAYSGVCVWDKLGFSVEDGAISKLDYGFEVYATPGVAVTA